MLLISLQDAMGLESQDPGDVIAPAAAVKPGRKDFIFFFLSFFFFCLLFRAAPMAHGSFQARGSVRAVAANNSHSHSNAGSELHLQPTPQLTSTPDP